MQFQEYKDSGWVSMECNAPRLDAGLKKGQTGKTLKDMVLSCPHKAFTPGRRYRILIEYGINNAIYLNTAVNSKSDEPFYYEPHIYEVADEFTLQ